MAGGNVLSCAHGDDARPRGAARGARPRRGGAAPTRRWPPPARLSARSPSPACAAIAGARLAASAAAATDPRDPALRDFVEYWLGPDRADRAPMRIALAQINATVGDIAGNEAAIRELLARGQAAGAQLVLFPELAVTGYPPEDLLLKEHFLRRRARRAGPDRRGRARDRRAASASPSAPRTSTTRGACCADGGSQAIYRKMHLPNYGVFDEVRYFQTGPRGALIEVDGVKVGLTICEDIWEPGPAGVRRGAGRRDLIVNISASPYHAGKGGEREQMIAQRARDNLARGRASARWSAARTSWSSTATRWSSTTRAR